MLDRIQTAAALPIPGDREVRPSARDEAFAELESSLYQALETYSNVHRGSGHKSMATTCLYERARNEVLRWMGFKKYQYTLIFCTPKRASALKAFLDPSDSDSLSSREIGLPLGIIALAVKKKALPKGVPFETGGGTLKMVSPGSVIWEDAPDRFEAGTPAVINAIAFAKALQIIDRFGFDIFKTQEPPTAKAFTWLGQDEFKQLSGRKLLDKLRGSLIGRDIQVPTTKGLRPFTNMDNAASTPTFLPVWRAVCQTWRQPERQWPSLIMEVRKICSRFFSAPLTKYDLIFTVSTTEALNLAAKNLALEPAADFEPVVLNTLLEHNSNEVPWRYAKGVSLVQMAVDDEGFINVKELEYVLRAYNRNRVHGKKRIRLVAVSGASNVLGTCNDIGQISRLAHQYGALLLVDGAQLAGHRKIRIEADGIDYLAFSGHKMYAPFGSGGLIARKGLLNFGKNALDEIKASGEENVIGIAALGKAIDLLRRIGMDVIQDEEQKLVRKALSEIGRVPDIEIFGLKDPSSPKCREKSGVICFSLKHVPHNLVAEKLAEHGGIGVRKGCFCAHLLVKHLLHIHPVREAMANLGLKFFPQFTKKVLPGLVRISFGLENSENEIDHLIKVLRNIGVQPVRFRDRLFAWTHNATPFLSVENVRQPIQAFLKTLATNVFGSEGIGEKKIHVFGNSFFWADSPDHRQPCCRHPFLWRIK